MYNGKLKALTFSYDDGVTQDIRLSQLFSKYGMKCTFNLNSALLGGEGSLTINNITVTHNKVKPEDVKHIYDGHEIAAHTLIHPMLPRITDDKEIIHQVEQDRLNLSELCGYEVVGFAYPGGGVNNDDRVAKIIRENTGIKYARTISTTRSFDVFENLYRYEGTVFHFSEWDKMFELGEEFLKLKTDKPAVFYIWGHAYEFDIYPERWGQFEEFLQMMSGKDDIFYGTNKEVLLAK